mmetsp:Transcript_3350/g.9578  ORF Transcript_3350/g.9578 Transcript_3350/m.9578 type:complete len:242 (-) Transcript_3350:137-862(-)
MVLYIEYDLPSFHLCGTQRCAPTTVAFSRSKEQPCSTRRAYTPRPRRSGVVNHVLPPKKNRLDGRVGFAVMGPARMLHGPRARPHLPASTQGCASECVRPRVKAAAAGRQGSIADDDRSPAAIPRGFFLHDSGVEGGPPTIPPTTTPPNDAGWIRGLAARDPSRVMIGGQRRGAEEGAQIPPVRAVPWGGAAICEQHTLGEARRGPLEQALGPNVAGSAGRPLTPGVSSTHVLHRVPALIN